MNIIDNEIYTINYESLILIKIGNYKKNKLLHYNYNYKLLEEKLDKIV